MAVRKSYLSSSYRCFFVWKGADLGGLYSTYSAGLSSPSFYNSINFFLLFAQGVLLQVAGCGFLGCIIEKLCLYVALKSVVCCLAFRVVCCLPVRIVYCLPVILSWIPAHTELTGWESTPVVRIMCCLTLGVVCCLTVGIVCCLVIRIVCCLMVRIVCCHTVRIVCCIMVMVVCCHTVRIVCCIMIRVVLA